MSMNSGVNRQLLSDQIYDGIREKIISGELPPGAPIIELELSRSLGVSQAPVRDAVKRLVHEGLLVHVPRRGSHVASVRPEDADAARRIRAVVEEHASRAVAAKHTDELIERLTELTSKMRDAAAAGDVGDFRDADVAFHRAVCQASDSSFLQAIWLLMEPKLRLWRVLSDPLYEGDWEWMADIHTHLVDALASGDVDESARLFAAHARGDLREQEQPAEKRR